MPGRKLTRIAALLIAAAIAVGLQAGAYGKKPARKAALKSKLGKVQSKIKVVRQKIKQKEGEKRVVLGQLSVTEQSLEKAQSGLATNKLRLIGAQSDLKQTIVRLDRTTRQLARRRELFSKRVVDVYEGEDLSYADVILGSTDMGTFLTRAYYLQCILESDTTLIRQIRADQLAIERDKARKARRVREISSLQVRLISERNEIASLADERQQQLDTIEHDKVLYEKMLDDLEAQSQAIEGQIRAFESTPKGRIRSMKPFRGGLSYPVMGRISSRFCYRRHPITGVYKLHTGIDICVPSGTPVHAAADGTVMSACYNRAYGYMVTIQHNGGISTLYGHNSKLLVRAGQEVKKGQVIAQSGSTGYSTGPHVHFEKRINGRPVNPEQ